VPAAGTGPFWDMGADVDGRVAHGLQFAGEVDHPARITGALKRHAETGPTAPEKELTPCRLQSASMR
jgi:hypothetical protein